MLQTTTIIQINMFSLCKVHTTHVYVKYFEFISNFGTVGGI